MIAFVGTGDCFHGNFYVVIACVHIAFVVIDCMEIAFFWIIFLDCSLVDCLHTWIDCMGSAFVLIACVVIAHMGIAFVVIESVVIACMKISCFCIAFVEFFGLLVGKAIQNEPAITAKAMTIQAISA